MNIGLARIKQGAHIVRVGAVLALVLAVSRAALAGPSILTAVQRGKEAEVVALLKANPGLVSSRDKLGNTPLHLAALHDQVAIAALLLANGADVNAQNYQNARSVAAEGLSGETPLSLALSSYHHKRMMELLLTHGAEVNCVLEDGMTPLLRAVERNLPDAVKLLLANSADPNAQVANPIAQLQGLTALELQLQGRTALDLAVIADEREIVQMLLDSGADPNARGLAGLTPLFLAETPPNSTFTYGGELSVRDPKIIAMLRAAGGHE